VMAATTTCQQALCGTTLLRGRKIVPRAVVSLGLPTE
jgi:hypothetical protein